ncbi:hypothetical protein FB45DRAFT_918580 [Roridomyces roridus]|uniref:DUF1308 domain-containing protein n=1 Tax=Roridomyces roridus TaxID=1738132 RepID=A0AAD7BR28_9AGAR|nr:hypothetical protein FB45DRAFT_918580 [Roridomyces roridus]
MSTTVSHPDLHLLRTSLCSIYKNICSFRPLTVRPPVLDSSTESLDSNDDDQWLLPEIIPGLNRLRDSLKVDLDVLDRFLDDPNSINLPPLSTNAPYLIAVWNEVMCAPPPIVSMLRSFSAPSDGHGKTAAVKVDVVADSGRRWIRINTIKNSRILAEFREIDSYLTGSEDESDEEQGPSLAQKELDNSVLRMARGLIAAARANPIDGEPPQLTLRLTRLDPSAPDERENDPRISLTIERLRAMGIDVDLGERIESEIPVPRPASHPIAPSQLVATTNINLDLSVLIALVSDLTHAPLPASVDEAYLRFGTPPRPPERPKHKAASDPSNQARALTTQIQKEMLQEMGNGSLFQELHKRLQHLEEAPQFWTTAEARERFVRIVSKIGGPGEKRRAEVLFQGPDGELVPDAEARFWEGSRFAVGFIPILPIRIYAEEQPPTEGAPMRPPFFRSMERTCQWILEQEQEQGVAVGATEPERVLYSTNGYQRNRGSERATVTRANARLTAHTVQSMLWGAQRGWTTLTANKTSVKALLREIKAARVAGRLVEDVLPEGEADLHEVAAIWITDPRSLAEGVRERVALKV